MQPTDIKQYIHLYIPFQFIWVEDAVPFKKGEIGLMDAEGLQYWDSYKKPILRKLSDMSEEEFKECDLKTHPKFWMTDSNIWCFTAEKTRYLLSKHFDLFNLIPDLAIDKTTLK